ncbi:hypothetical protein R1flu_010379 [Riccia fluitans]|uniref:Aminotransferase-like plant mobile domain-containing protein n=1 Tax=Riccia fluitans TaxID=41844 RepID=A0ABD1Z4T9_9MARC
MADKAMGQRLPTIRMMDEDLYKANTTDTRGGTNVIGWNEIAIIFRAKHNDKEDFRSIKVMHTTLDKYNPRSYLPVSIEANPNKNLVSGQRYEEILYYKDAAPYGPIYHLMTTVAELFWSQGRSNRFLTPMILAYLRGLHGHSYNWAKAILHYLWTEILFLQLRACHNEGGKSIPIVWAPCFVHILFSLRRTLFAGTPLEEAEGWIGWTHVMKDTNMSLAQLHSKFPTLITSLDDLRQRCKLPEEIPIASSERMDSNAARKKIYYKRGSKTDQPRSTKRPHEKDNERGLPSTKINKETDDGLREQLDAKDAKKSNVHALARTEVQRELEEFKRSVKVKKNAAEETHQQKLAQVQTELEEYKRSSEASIKRLDEEASCLREALATKSPLCRFLLMLTRRRSPPSRQHVESTRRRWMEK